MASSKRSTSPSHPPAWLLELLQALQGLQNDFLRHESAIREIRSITLENQHLLRTRVRNAMETKAMAPTTVRTTPSTRIAKPPAPIPFAIPKPKLSVDTTPKICWYHRQFGKASIQCIEPCAFAPPPVIQPKVAKPKTIMRRVIINEPNTKPVTEEIPTSATEVQSKQPVDWNEENERRKKFPRLSDSSSSSSSESSESEEEVEKKPAEEKK